MVGGWGYGRVREGELYLESGRVDGGRVVEMVSTWVIKFLLHFNFEAKGVELVVVVSCNIHSFACKTLPSVFPLHNLDRAICTSSKYSPLEFINRVGEFGALLHQNFCD